MNTDKPDAVELLNCPFCGGTANLHNDESEFWYVACRECITQTTHFYNGRDIVIDRWNTRDSAENDRLKKEVAVGKALLEEAFIATLCHHHLLFKLRDALNVDWSLVDKSCAKCDLSMRLYKAFRPTAFAALEGDSQ